MNNVDNRVVQMGFDNKQFETNVEQSTRSLDMLKKSLNLEGAGKGLSELSAAGRSFSLQGIADGVESISSKFTALGVVGFTIMQNLTNAAIGYGQKIMNAMTSSIKQGFGEYEIQMNAIQTILANTQSKGTTLDEVSAALDELNTYSDKTIYNFSEMTKNVGTFTASGINLKDSVAAIKGIANLAAVSGSNSQQASTAMYQLSQALSTGTLRLMDWNSVVNAGMGGQVFQDALKQTARAHGTAVDAIIKKEGSFRESLKQGWITSSILTETLAQFTGDLTRDQLVSMGYTEQQIEGIMKMGQTAQDAASKVKTFSQLKQTLDEALGSGWAQTWRLVVGDFEEAKKLFSAVSDVLGGMVNRSSNARNEVLTAWKRFGGKVALVDTVKNAFTALSSILTHIQQGFKEIFPPITGQQLKLMTVFVRDLVAKFIIFENQAEGIRRTAKGVAAVFDLLIFGFTSLIKGIGKLYSTYVKSTGSLISDVLEFTGGIGDWLVGLRDSIKYGNLFGKMFDNAKTALGPFIAQFKVVQAHIAAFIATLQPTLDKIKGFFSQGFSKVDTSGADSFFDKLKLRFEPVSKLFEGLGKVLTWFWDLLKKMSPFFAQIGTFLVNVVSQLSTSVMEGVNTLDFNKVFDIVNGGLLAALILAIKNFVQKGSGAFDGIADLLDGVKGSLQAWQTSLKAKTLLTIAAAIGILAISVIALSMVDSAKLTKSLTALTVMFAQLMASMAVFDKMGGKGAAQIAVQMVAIAGALLLISVAVAILGNLDPLKLTNGLIGVGIVLTELALFMQATKLGGMGASKSVGIILLAEALLILAGAVALFGNLKPEVLRQGLIGVGAVLTELAVFVTLTGDSKRVISTAIGLTILGGAMLIFGKAIENIGKIPADQLQQGLIGMAIALGVVIAAIDLMPKDGILKAGALLVVSAALVIMANALGTLGKMKWEELRMGLIALASTLAILVVGMYAMQGALSGAAALIIVAGALAILAPVLKLLGSMSWEELGKGLAVLAGVFVILGVAGLALTPLIPTLAALSGVLFLFGLACVMVGAGVLAFSAGLAALAVSGVAGAGAIVVIISSLIGLIPAIAIALANGIISFAAALGAGIPVLGQTLSILLQTLLGLIITFVPQIVAGALFLVKSLLEGLAANLPAIIQAGMDIIVAILTGIGNNIGRIVTAAIDIVTNFIDAVAKKIPDVIQSGWNLIISFINGIADSIEKNQPELQKAINKLGAAIVDGLCDGLTSGVGGVIAAIGKLAGAAIDALKTILGIFSPSRVTTELGELTTEGFVVGLLNFAGKVKKASAEIGKRATSGMGEAIGQISDAVNNNMDASPTIRPVIDLAELIAGSKQVDRLLTGKTLDVTGTLDKVSTVSAGMKKANSVNETTQINQNGSQPPIVFEQNNYSPVALSRVEIYRQTRNQLFMLKGLVGNT